MSWISHVDGSHIAELRCVDDHPCLGAPFDKDTVRTINGESRRPLFWGFHDWESLVTVYVVIDGSPFVSRHTSPGISMHREPNARETLGRSTAIEGVLLCERERKHVKERCRVPGWKGDIWT